MVFNSSPLIFYLCSYYKIKMTTQYRFLLLIIFLLMQAVLLVAQGDRTQLEQDKKKVEEEIKYTNTLLEQTRQSKTLSLQEVIILNEMIRKISP